MFVLLEAVSCVFSWAEDKFPPWLTNKDIFYSILFYFILFYFISKNKYYEPIQEDDVSKESLAISRSRSSAVVKSIYYIWEVQFWSISATLYFYSVTSEREILYFLLHHIYLITLVTLHVQISNTKYN